MAERLDKTGKSIDDNGDGGDNRDDDVCNNDDSENVSRRTVGQAALTFDIGVCFLAQCLRVVVDRVVLIVPGRH